MSEDIYQGWDCCISYPTKAAPVRIHPGKATVAPGEDVQLEAQNIHGDCDPECFVWMIEAGGGELLTNVGRYNTWTAPPYNDDCSGNATIALICRGKIIDYAYMGTDSGKFTGPAYAVVRYDPDAWWCHKGEGYAERLSSPPGGTRLDWQYNITFWWYYYTCSDDFYNKAQFTRETFYFKYGPNDDKWHVYSTWNWKLNGTWDDVGQIPVNKFSPIFPQIQEVTARISKKKGCCPAGYFKQLHEGVKPRVG